ncbi:hypothetical protein OTU49_005780, partial [Cherax quadricarinatus]
MSVYAQALSFIDTALRIPPLFIMDEVLKCCFGFSGSIGVRYASLLSDGNPFLNDEGFGQLHHDDMKMWATENDTSLGLEDYSIFASIAPTVAKVFMFIFVYIIATVAFLLSSQRLIQVYIVVASMAVVVAGYQVNMATVRYLTSPPLSEHPSLIYSILSLNATELWDSGGTLSILTLNYIFQGSLGYLFTLLYSGPQYPLLHRFMILSFLLPNISLFFALPSGILSAVPLFAALLPLA